MADRESSPKPGVGKSAEPTVKTCKCGAAYSLAEWQRLNFLGVFPVDGAAGRFGELRGCASCGSSISVRVRAVACLALVPESEVSP